VPGLLPTSIGTDASKDKSPVRAYKHSVLEWYRAGPMQVLVTIAVEPILCQRHLPSVPQKPLQSGHVGAIKKQTMQCVQMQV
jgi:hypothetical protein